MKTENRKPKTESHKPKALVLYGYGLNCDYETQFALNLAGAAAHRVHTTDLLEHPATLWDYQLLAIPGGFSWGDEHGAGVILALRLKLALGAALQEFVAGGRLVMGICNGFQVLVNLGLLPACRGGRAAAWRRCCPTIAATSGTPGCIWRSLGPTASSPKDWTCWSCRSATGKGNSSRPRRCSRRSGIRARSP